MQRRALVQSGESQTPNTSAISSAQLAEPPQLRFLAWQDEWTSNQVAAVRHPDGSPVTINQELDWLHHVTPGATSGEFRGPNWPKISPHYLYLWFSHPLFDGISFFELTLTDGNGKNLSDTYSFRSTQVVAAGSQNGNTPWLVGNLMCGETTNVPSRVTVRLRYAVGPLEQPQEFPPDYGGELALLGGGYLNGIGQDAHGWTFIAVTVNPAMLESRRYIMEALTKDGRRLTSAGIVTGEADRNGIKQGRFHFDVPLSNVAKFIIGTRPIRQVEWKNVVLPGYSDSDSKNANFTRSETITIAADGALTVAGEPCPVAQLTERINQLAARQPVSVAIQADAKAAMKWVVAVAKACQIAGLPMKLARLSGEPVPVEASTVGDSSLPVVVDLRPYYANTINAGSNDLQVVDGLPFAANGEVLLYGQRDAEGNNVYPTEVTGIKIGRTFDELHLIHSVRWREYHGCPVAVVRLNYADGTRHDFEIRYNFQVLDWNRLLSEEREVIDDPATKIIKRTGPTSLKGTGRLFKSVQKNPFPEKEVVSMDVISTRSRASYKLNAVTVAKTDPHREITAAVPLNQPGYHFDGTLKVQVVDKETGAPIIGADVNPYMSVDGVSVTADPMLTSTNGVVQVKYPVRRTSYVGVRVSKPGYVDCGDHWESGHIPDTITYRLVQDDSQNAKRKP